jgi:hypothetical protein
MFAWECVTLGFNCIVLIAIYQLKQLNYEPRSLSCDYYQHHDIYFLSGALALALAVYSTCLGIQSGIITPTVLLLTVISWVFSLLAFNEDVERSRLERIEKSLEQLRYKYDIVIEPLYQLLVDHAMQGLPLSTIEFKLLTSEQKKMKVISDSEVRRQVEAFIRTELIAVFNKRAEYKEIEKQVSTIKAWV